MDILRQRARQPMSVDVILADMQSPQGSGEEDKLAIAQAMQRLSPPHSEILRLRYYGDLSYLELAQILEIAHGTVMSRLYLARKALARKLNEETT